MQQAALGQKAVGPEVSVTAAALSAGLAAVGCTLLEEELAGLFEVINPKSNNDRSSDPVMPVRQFVSALRASHYKRVTRVS